MFETSAKYFLNYVSKIEFLIYAYTVPNVF